MSSGFNIIEKFLVRCLYRVNEVDIELEIESALVRVFNFEAGFAIEHVPNLTEEAEGVLRVREDFVNNFDEAFRVFSKLLLQCCKERFRPRTSAGVGAMTRLELGSFSDGWIEPATQFPDCLFAACSQAVALGSFLRCSERAVFHEDLSAF